LGVDPKTLPNYVTLGELGMESMLAVELQQSLEREYEVKLTLNQIKKITVRQMKEFQNGNKDQMKKIAKDFKLAKANLSKIKFIIPIDTHTRLNAVQNGSPIYILPPVEGLFTSFEDLAKKINRPVIALNLTRGMNNMKNMKEISAYFMNLLKTLSPNGNYDIIGHSFGALILAKISRKAPIGRAVIIDLISDTSVDKESLNDEELFESIQKFIQQNMPESFRDRMDKEIDSTKDIDEKIKKIVNELKEFGGKNLIGKDMEEIFKLSLERGKLLYNYRVKLKKKFDKMKNLMKNKYLKMNGKLLIIKPHEGSDDSDIMDVISESYNLHKEV
jgi:thioesterase domain-containing protein/acyl carrier protein